MTHDPSEYQPGQWWLKELEKHLNGEMDYDTRRAAGVAIDFAKAVFDSRMTDEEAYQHFGKVYSAAKSDYQLACALSGRLRYLDKRIKATNRRADALEARLKALATFEEMPPTDDRQPDETLPGDYLESNREWANRNNEAVEWFIDNHEAIRAAVAASRLTKPASNPT